MTSMFKIERCFTIESRNYKILAGQVLSGGIKVGDRIVKENREVIIKGIEMLDRSNRPVDSLLSIVIEYKNLKESDEFDKLFPEGEVICISSPSIVVNHN